MKNHLIKIALIIFRWITNKYQHGSSNRSSTQTILIVTTTGLGDTLWATPAIESVRKSFPLASITVLTSSLGMEILKYNPNLDRLCELKEPVLYNLYSLWKLLWKQQFNTILLFHASQRLVLPFCAALGAKTITGTSGINKGLDIYLTDPLPKQYEHEIIRRLRIVEHIGGDIHSKNLSFFLQPRERLHIPRKKLQIIIHPGAADPFKRWPWQNFAKIGLQLQKQFGADILITGTQAEKKIMKQVAEKIPRSRLMDCNLPLRTFAALIEQTDLLICNDTGPFHLACALKKNVVGIFAATDPVLCGSLNNQNAIVITTKPCCTPCLKRKCLNPICQWQISTCEVFESVPNLF